jgi:hypothetical protein
MNAVARGLEARSHPRGSKLDQFDPFRPFAIIRVRAENTRSRA